MELVAGTDRRVRMGAVLSKSNQLGNSLVVQQLGLGTFTAGARVITGWGTKILKASQWDPPPPEKKSNHLF